MKIGVLGTGMVGSAIAGKLKQLGHDVRLGSRHPASDKAGVPVVSHEAAAQHGDWIVLCLPGESVLETLDGLEIGNKILVDISNFDSAIKEPLEEPLAQLIQRTYPEARVVKTLNSISAHLMVDPQSLGAPHSVFVAGNDTGAKDEVTELLKSFGWSDIIDLGDLSATRAMENLAAVWVSLEAVLDVGPNFTLAVVRGDKMAD